MFKKIIVSSLFLYLFSFLFIFSIASPVFADDTLNGLNLTANKINAFSGQTSNSNVYYQNFIQTKAGTIIGSVLSLVGVLFLIMMIYAGIMWMTAQGNDQQVTKAKDLLINSIIGIIIVFAAYAITALVGNFVTNQLLQ